MMIGCCGYWGPAQCVTWVRLPLLDLLEDTSLSLVGGATAVCPASLWGSPAQVIPVALSSTSCCLGHRFLGVDWSRDVAALACSCCITLTEVSEFVSGASSMKERFVSVLGGVPKLKLTKLPGCG